MATETNTTGAKISTDGKFLVITLPLNKNGVPSASGKTLVVATTGGFMSTTAKANGKDISISVNATVKP